ncbi:MAG: hypothetical protein V1897_19660 [Pseudomonadota bacterium]
MDKKLTTGILFLGLALASVSLWACVPALKEVKSDKVSESQDKKTAEPVKEKSGEKPPEQKSEPPKGTKTEPLKNKITDDWLSGRPLPNTKDKISNSKSTQGKSGKPLSEEEKVLSVATETVSSVASPIKYTVCYDQEKAEWWLTIYDDIGYAFDVKKFFWNPELEKFEPFLVLNKISKSRLNDEISKKSDTKKCSVHDVKSPAR